jgi:energy-coupling factor transport system permease protein
MLDKANRILDAQQARGLRAGGSFGARGRAIVPLLGPLIIGSLIDVRERTLALEARAFGAAGPRTAYRAIPMRPVDGRAVRLVLLVGLFLVAVAVARVIGLVGG